MNSSTGQCEKEQPTESRAEQFQALFDRLSDQQQADLLRFAVAFYACSDRDEVQ